MTRDEHLAKIYLTGARTVGNRTHPVLLCGGLDCAGAEIVVAGLPTVANIVAEADAHITKMEALGG